MSTTLARKLRRIPLQTTLTLIISEDGTSEMVRVLKYRSDLMITIARLVVIEEWQQKRRVRTDLERQNCRERKNRKSK